MGGISSAYCLADYFKFFDSKSMNLVQHCIEESANLCQKFTVLF